VGGGRGRLAARDLGDVRAELPVHLPRCPVRRAAARQPHPRRVLAGITAAVVGVIANLAVYFTVATLFARVVTVERGSLALHVPDVTTLRPVPLVIALLAAVLLFALRQPVLRVLGVCAVLGLAAGLAGLPIA
jgi:hypothetical protein